MWRGVILKLCKRPEDLGTACYKWLARNWQESRIISCARDQLSRKLRWPIAVSGEVPWRTTRYENPTPNRADAGSHKPSQRQEASFSYQPGFGNHFVSEAVAGALPVGRNSPQQPPLGLYAEQISGTSFTTARAENRRTWTYRIHPSVVHRPYARIDNGLIRSAPFNETDATPTQLRWSPFPIPRKPTDFVDGIITLGGNGDAATQIGMAIHVYAANRSMKDRCFYNADGEMLIVPQQGRARFVTELGVIEAGSGEIVIIPRGLRFRVELPDGPSRGYICENYGAMLRLPELGPLGANGLASARDFLAPVAAYEDVSGAAGAWSPNSRAIFGRRKWIIRRLTLSPGTATSRPTNTILRALTSSDR